MKNSHRIVWSKGMFMTPQHFQTQDQFSEDNLHFRFGSTCFANWGVTQLRIDLESLANGLFTLQSCCGILPDGLIFNIPEVDPLPTGRDVAPFFPPTQERLDVFLAIPARRVRGKNVTLLPGAPSESQLAHVASRYIAETQLVADENSGIEEKPVQLARPNFRLLFGGESLDGFSSLRLAQVIRTPAGTYALHPRFVAPCLDIVSSDYLMLLVRRAVERLASKSNAMSAPRRQEGRGLSNLTASEVYNFWLLHTVKSYLPVLKHIWTVRRGHPEALFVSMLHLAGALSTFSSDVDPAEFPTYDHDDLGSCFSALDEKMETLLRQLFKENFVSVELQLSEKSIWSGTIREDEHFKNSQFYLAMSAQIGVDDLIRKVPQLIKIAPTNEIQRVVRVALPGITLRHVPSPPAAIPLKLDNQYFSLNQGGVLWEGITSSRNISLYIPSDIVSPRPELLIVFSEGG